MLKNGLIDPNKRYIIILAPRQVGKSIVLCNFAVWYSIFNKEKIIALACNKEDIAKLQLARVKLAFENLPIWLKPGVVEWSKTSVEFEDERKIICASTSSSSLRGESINFLILDEFAFVSKNLQRDFFSSVYPTIAASKTSRIVIISTMPDVKSKKELDENLYWQLWSGAKKGKNKYFPIEVFPDEIPGRDAQWEYETMVNMGDIDDPETIRRFKIEFKNELIFSDSKKLIGNDYIKKLKNNFNKWINQKLNNI